MQLLGERRNGDVHLTFPQLLLDQVTAVLALRRIGHGPASAVGMWKEAEPKKNVSLLVLSSGDLDRIERIFLEAFEDRAQPWMLVQPSFRTTNMGRFAWDIVVRPEGPATKPKLTRWFDTALQEVPSLRGAYEGADDVSVEPAKPIFFYWDGEAWCLAGPTAEAAHARSTGSRGPAPRFWRGLKSAATG